MHVGHDSKFQIPGGGKNELFSQGNLNPLHLDIPFFKLAKFLKFLDLEQKLCQKKG